MFAIVFALMIAQSPLHVASTTQIIKTDVSNLNEPIPILANGYIDFIKCATYFVDNSMLIEKFLINGALSGAHVITMPKRFGKTLNTFMLKEFLSIKIERETGRRIPLKKTATYNLFNHGKLIAGLNKTVNLNTDFLIKKKKDVMALLGSPPVIYISLKACGSTFKSLKDVENLVRLRALQSLREHRYLRKSPDLQTEFDTNNNLAPGSTVHDITAVIVNLESMLFHFFDKKAFVIVDDYDGVMNQVFTQKYKLPEGEKNQIVEFFISFYSGILSDSANVQGALLTGILPWQELGSISSTSNFKYYDSFTSDIVEYYGMMPEHITTLLDELSLTHHNEGVIKNYYSYQCGRNGTNIKFNPYSIANFLREKKVLNFWSESAEVFPLIKSALEIEHSHRALKKLLLKGNQEIVIRNRNLLTRDEFHTISKYIIETTICKDDQSPMTNVMLKYLFAQGYFTQEPGSLSLVGDRGSFTIRIKISNDEVFAVLWQNYGKAVMRNDRWQDDDLTFYKAFEKSAAASCRFHATDATLESKDLESAAERLLGYLPQQTNGRTVIDIFKWNTNICESASSKALLTYGDDSPNATGAVNYYMPYIKSYFGNSTNNLFSQIKVADIHIFTNKTVSVESRIITREEVNMK